MTSYTVASKYRYSPFTVYLLEDGTADECMDTYERFRFRQGYELTIYHSVDGGPDIKVPYVDAYDLLCQLQDIEAR